MASVAPATVTRFETEKGDISLGSIKALSTALESAGVTFLPDDGDGPGVRFKRAE